MAACIATLKPFAKRFFPRLLGKNSSRDGGYPKMQGKATKLKGSPYDGQSFHLQSYGDDDLGQHLATVTTKSGRDPRRRDGDAESQESIIRVVEGEMNGKEGVVVTRTVQVS